MRITSKGNVQIGGPTSTTSAWQTLLLGTTASKQSNFGPEMITAAATNSADPQNRRVVLWSGAEAEQMAMFLINSTGMLEWGAGGSNDQDCNLSRSGPNQLFLSKTSLGLAVNGDPQPRILLKYDGTGIFWGNGTGYPDVPISRPFYSVLVATGTLKLRPSSSFNANGTVTISSTSTTVTGDANTGTLFTQQVRVGDNIQVFGVTRTVTAVTDDTHLTENSNFGTDQSGQAMTVLSFDATGTATFNSTAVTGTNTHFTTEVGLGDRITINGQTQTVIAIPSDTSLTVGPGFTGMGSGPVMTVLPSIFRADDTSGTPRLIVSDQGKVGIGTAAPQALLDVAGQARVKPVTVATLPAAVAALQGAIACVTDANATTYYTVVVGAGTNVVMVFCDGTNWRVF